MKVAAYALIRGLLRRSAGDGSEIQVTFFCMTADIDGLVLAAPTTGAYQTVEACKAGKGVYCEKPFYVVAEVGLWFKRLDITELSSWHSPPKRALYHAAFDSGREQNW